VYVLFSRIEHVSASALPQCSCHKLLCCPCVKIQSVFGPVWPSSNSEFLFPSHVSLSSPAAPLASTHIDYYSPKPLNFIEFRHARKGDRVPTISHSVYIFASSPDYSPTFQCVSLFLYCSTRCEQLYYKQIEFIIQDDILQSV
jgi:hypothetical protein